MVEGARLERVYTGNRIEGSNPSLTATYVLYGPETWVTERTYDMGDNLVPNGLSMVCKVLCSRSIYPRS